MLTPTPSAPSATSATSNTTGIGSPVLARPDFEVLDAFEVVLEEEAFEEEVEEEVEEGFSAVVDDEDAVDEDFSDVVDEEDDSSGVVFFDSTGVVGFAS